MAEHRISRFPVPELADLPDDIRERIEDVAERSGFIPNVFLALAHRPEEFRAFMAYHDTLMDKSEGLSKAERELIVVATSAVNDCQYCVVAHGAILRIRAKNPLIADQVSVNPWKADLTERERHIVELALHVCTDSGTVLDDDIETMRAERLHRRRDLGHRGDRCLLRDVEPRRQFRVDPSERRVLRHGSLDRVPTAPTGDSRSAEA